MNTIKESALIGPDGRPRFGIFSGPLTSLSLDDFRPYGAKERASSAKRRILQYRIKRWEYIGVCNDEIICGIAILNLGYLCNSFAYLFDRRNNRLSQYDILTPGRGAAVFAGTSETGDISFRHGNTAARMTSDPDTITVQGSVKGELFIDLSFRKYREPLVCLTRVGLKGFNYTHKEAGNPVRGTIRHQGVTWNIQEDRSFGVLDYTLGYLARHTFWNWASGGGTDKEGNRIGFNLVQGVNETGFTENVFWINGRRVKTDVMDFRYDDRDLLKPWRIESNDGKIRLRFMPAGTRSADINAGLIVSKFHQPFGRFEGTLQDGDQTCELENASGFTEEHYAKW